MYVSLTADREDYKRNQLTLEADVCRIEHLLSLLGEKGDKPKIKIEGNIKKKLEGFLGGAVVENLPANAGDTGSSPGLGRSHVPRSN